MGRFTWALDARKVALGACIAVLSFAMLSSAEELREMRMINGVCEPSSHIAEGPIGADLTKRQSRFFCDAAIIGFFGRSKTHTLVQFSEKGSHHGQIIGYAGDMPEGQNILTVDHVYLTQAVATPVTEGYCKFFYKATRLSGISCGAKIDEGNRRTVPIIAFDVTPQQ